MHGVEIGIFEESVFPGRAEGISQIAEVHFDKPGLSSLIDPDIQPGIGKSRVCFLQCPANAQSQMPYLSQKIFGVFIGKCMG